MTATEEKPTRRIVVEVDLETRRRLKTVAAKRDLTIKGLIALLAERAEDCLDRTSDTRAPYTTNDAAEH